MRWTRHPYPQPEEGTQRSRLVFAWLPVQTVEGQLVWLERVQRVEAYSRIEKCWYLRAYRDADAVLPTETPPPSEASPVPQPSGGSRPVAPTAAERTRRIELEATRANAR